MNKYTTINKIALPIFRFAFKPALKAVVIDYNIIYALVKYNVISASVDAMELAARFAKVGFGTYIIRELGKVYQEQYAGIVGNETAQNFPLSYYTGVIGGSFRYSLMGKKHYEIGGVNNLLYEICNNYEACSGNPLTSSVFTIAVETADALAQSYFKGDLTDITKTALNGATTGAIISFLVYFAYIPLNTVENYFFPATEPGVDIPGNCTIINEGE